MTHIIDEYLSVSLESATTVLSQRLTSLDQHIALTKQRLGQQELLLEQLSMNGYEQATARRTLANLQSLASILETRRKLAAESLDALSAHRSNNADRRPAAVDSRRHRTASGFRREHDPHPVTI